LKRRCVWRNRVLLRGTEIRLGVSSIRRCAGLLGPDAPHSWSARPIWRSDTCGCTARAGAPLGVGAAWRDQRC
jgi:hypothetical protein